MESDLSSLTTAADMLVTAGWLESATDVVDFFRKSRKWDPQIELWRSCGSPALGDAGWDLFTQRLERADGQAMDQ